MIKQAVIGTLETLLKGVDDENQEIFKTIKLREEVVINERKHESNEDARSEQEKSEKNYGSGSSKSAKGNASIITTTKSEQEEDIEVGNTTRYERRVRILTYTGQRFVNAMLDHATATRADELSMNGEETIGEFPYPNLKLVRILDNSQMVYFNNDAEVLNYGNGLLLNYPRYDIEAVGFEVDENGDLVEPMMVHEFQRTWQAILKVTKLDSAKSLNVATKLRKETKYFNDVKVAYCNGKLMQKYGDMPTYDEQVLAYITGAEWNVSVEQFLRNTNGTFKMTDFQRNLWLAESLGGSSSNSGKGRSKRNNPKFNKVNKAIKANSENNLTDNQESSSNNNN